LSMETIDTVGILRRVYGDALDLHLDLHGESNAHRERHGSSCGAYPSEPSNAPFGGFWGPR
jgi:hypothetical protein